MDNCCLTSPITVFALPNGVPVVVVGRFVAVEVVVVVVKTVIETFRLVTDNKGTSGSVLLAEHDIDFSVFNWAVLLNGKLT
jgi:hypothetical protein